MLKCFISFLSYVSGIFHKHWARNFQNVHLCSPEVDISMLGKLFLVDTNSLKTDAMNRFLLSVRFNSKPGYKLCNLL